MNFVVVDNNKSDLELLAKALRKAAPECQIQPFTDPLLSAKYICNNPVDMVFLADIMRPVNGFRLMQVLRKNVPKLTVVMLSNDDRNRIDAVRAGVDDYLVKPISPHVVECFLIGRQIKKHPIVDMGQITRTWSEFQAE